MKLDEKLKELDTYPFHMPGHKRNKQYELPSSDIDITEIDGFDNLHKPKEILLELQNNITSIFGYKKSILSVNGSTCCILAAISAVCSRGDKIIIARNCHKSVYNACYINQLKVVYLEPEFNSEYGFYGKVCQKDVDKIIKDNPDACAVVITSPTYEGIISDIKATIPLILDNAHGAHFGFSDFLPARQNADIVIQSIHKTLPSLTQTALIHINNDSFYDKVKMYMDIFETSSPSYILIDSAEKCVEFLKHSKVDFDTYHKMLNYFYSEVEHINTISVFKNDDPTRIILSAEGMSGCEFADILRKEYKIEVEGFGLKHIILISTVADTIDGFNRLLNALKAMPLKKSKNLSIHKFEITQKEYELYEITQTAESDLKKSKDLICAEYIYAYPPGAPIIAPGEIITDSIIEYVCKLLDLGVNVLSDSDLLPDKILTKA